MNEIIKLANERESIRLLKESGVPDPWTEDDRLDRIHFPNVFREDDPTTAWIRSEILEPYRDDYTRVLQMSVVCRLYGTVGAIKQIEHILMADELDLSEVKAIMDARPKRYSRNFWRYAYYVSYPQLKTDPAELAEKVAKIGPCNDRELLRQLTDLAVGRYVYDEVLADMRGTCVLEGYPETTVPTMRHQGVDRAVLRKHKYQYEPALQLLRDTLEASKTDWAYPDRPLTLTAVNRAYDIYHTYHHRGSHRERERSGRRQR